MTHCWLAHGPIQLSVSEGKVLPFIYKGKAESTGVSMRPNSGDHTTSPLEIYALLQNSTEPYKGHKEMYLKYKLIY